MHDLSILHLFLMDSFLNVHLEVHLIKNSYFFFIFLVLRLPMKVPHASVSLDLVLDVLLENMNEQIYSCISCDNIHPPQINFSWNPSITI